MENKITQELIEEAKKVESAEVLDVEMEDVAGGARRGSEMAVCIKCGYTIDSAFAIEMSCCPKCGYGK